MTRRPEWFGVALIALGAWGCSPARTDESGSAQKQTGQTTQAQTSVAGSGSDTKRRPHGPPPEALEACKSLAEGADCQVQFAARSLDGTCRQGPGDSTTVACAPRDLPPPPGGKHRGPPPGGHRGPPEEALTACKTLTEGADCQVELAAKSMDGVCRKGPGDKDVVACAPAGDRPPLPPGGHRGPPPGGPREPPAEAVTACQSIAVGEACKVDFPARSLAGTCRKGPDASLACLPKDMGPHGGPRGRPPGPPAEAVTACQSIAVGEACKVDFPARSLAGTCRKGPDTSLACLPKDFPGPR